MILNSARAIFLDRDGVINKANVIEGKPYPPINLDALEIIDNVGDSLKALRELGFYLFIVTNQPDVARGVTRQSEVEKINQYLLDTLTLDGIYVCYHDDRDACKCRKPEIGFLLDLREKYDLCLSDSYVIGDRWRDIEMGQRAGCKTVFIDYGYQEKQPVNPDFIVDSLSDFVEKLWKGFYG